MKLLALTIPGEQKIDPPAGIPQGGLHDANGGGGIIKTTISLLLIVVSVLSLFYLIFGGFKWMTSNGDQEKLKSARVTIIYAIVGLGISLLSFAIITLLSNFFHVDLLTF